MSSNKWGFDDILKEFNKLKTNIGRDIGKEAVAHFKGNFERQGFDSAGWDEVQRRIPTTNAYKYPKTKKLSRRTKPILMDTGRLKRSIRVGSTFNGRIVIVSDTKYSKYINDGTDKMPQRKFMGDSYALRAKLEKLINTKIIDIINRYGGTR